MTAHISPYEADHPERATAFHAEILADLADPRPRLFEGIEPRYRTPKRRRAIALNRKRAAADAIARAIAEGYEVSDYVIAEWRACRDYLEGTNE